MNRELIVITKDGQTPIAEAGEGWYLPTHKRKGRKRKFHYFVYKHPVCKTSFKHGYLIKRDHSLEEMCISCIGELKAWESRGERFRIIVQFKDALQDLMLQLYYGNVSSDDAKEILPVLKWADRLKFFPNKRTRQYESLQDAIEKLEAILQPSVILEALKSLKDNLKSYLTRSDG